MNTYAIWVCYRGVYKRHFHDRDQALAWIATEVSKGLDFEEFEIMDRSDA